MPFIDVKITKKLSNDDENALKCKFGEAISIFPGKSENWLMCNFESESHIWFQGNNHFDSAFIEVKLYGTVDKNAANKFTAEICSFFDSQFAISPSRVYIRYSGGTDWGWNGSNL